MAEAPGLKLSFPKGFMLEPESSGLESPGKPPEPGCENNNGFAIPKVEAPGVEELIIFVKSSIRAT